MVGIDTLARVLAAAILIWAAVAKATSREPDRLRPYGIPATLRSPAYYALAAVEAIVGVLLLLGTPLAPFAALGLGALFIGALSLARARGVRRLDCGCFGSKEQSVELLLLRAAGFTGLAALAHFSFDVSAPSRESLLLVGFVVLALAVLVLAALVLALYRQVGILTLRIGPGVALELAEEGPELGQPVPYLKQLEGVGHELAVFFSPGCRLCRQLAPAVRALGREGLAVHVVDGIVAAKGTANTLEQLEQLIVLGAERIEYAAA